MECKRCGKQVERMDEMCLGKHGWINLCDACIKKMDELMDSYVWCDEMVDLSDAEIKLLLEIEKNARMAIGEFTYGSEEEKRLRAIMKKAVEDIHTIPCMA